MMKVTLRDVPMMVVIAVDIMLIHSIARNASALKIWAVLLHQHWLEMGIVTMKPTWQCVPMMVGTAVVIVSIQIFALHVYVI